MTLAEGTSEALIILISSPLINFLCSSVVFNTSLNRKISIHQGDWSSVVLTNSNLIKPLYLLFFCDAIDFYHTKLLIVAKLHLGIPLVVHWKLYVCIRVNFTIFLYGKFNSLLLSNCYPNFQSLREFLHSTDGYKRNTPKL